MASTRFSALLIFLLAAAKAAAADIDTMGGTLLHQVAPNLIGTGIIVGQVEAPNAPDGPMAFQVNPGAPSVLQPTNLFTWLSSSGTANTFPNSVGTESTHADAVAGNFYGNTTNGVAPGVAHVDNYEANFFSDNYISSPQAIPDRVVNQSFIFANADGSHFASNVEAQIDSEYDDAAVQYNVLFVSGAGNDSNKTVYPAATCYNGIGVGVFPGSSSTAPTYNGRSKPDLVAPGGITSFSTPLVAGSAAVLIQAALRGDGGSDTNSANDNRTIKALILNGAVKPAGWTNGMTTPLDARYGAGLLNVFNSWHQLKGGKHPFIESTSVLDGQPHPPGTNPGNVPALTGWDLNSITSPPDLLHDTINHYYFNLTGSNAFTLTATLTWLRPHTLIQSVPTGINDLNLFLYNTANGNLVLCSTSKVDNVEHLTLPSLPPGRYDLQVQKNPNIEISLGETYALAFEFFNIAMSIHETNNSVAISWPLAPQGFELLSTTSNLNSPVTSSPVTNAVALDTNANVDVVTVPVLPGANQFFWLQRP